MNFDDEDLETITFRDIRNIAKEYILLYFADKNLTDEELLTDRNVYFTVNLNNRDLPILYKAMSRKKEFVKKKKNQVPPDIVFVIKGLSRCSKLLIPVNYSVGLLAVHLEMLKNCVVDI